MGFRLEKNKHMIPIASPLHLGVYILLVIIKHIALALWYLACLIFEPIVPTAIINVAMFAYDQRQIIVSVVVLIFAIKYYSNKTIQEISAARITIRFSDKCCAVLSFKTKNKRQIKKSQSIAKKRIAFDEKVDFIECSESCKTLMIRSRALNSDEDTQQSRERLLEGKRRKRLARMRSS
jgi:hypothetical protein